MKSPETAVRILRFEADEKARKVQDLEFMIHDFEQMAHDLDRQIRAEEERTGIKDKEHFSYSTFAKSAMQRRDNLAASIEELREKHAAAKQDHEEAIDRLEGAQSKSEGLGPDRQSSRFAVASSTPGGSAHR